MFSCGLGRTMNRRMLALLLTTLMLTGLGVTTTPALADTISGGNGQDRVFGTPREINEHFVLNLSARVPRWTSNEEIDHADESAEVSAYRQRLVELLDAIDAEFEVQE